MTKLGRPPLDPKPEQARKTALLSLPIAVWNTVRLMADENGLSVNNMEIVLLQEALEARKKKRLEESKVEVLSVQ